jgi:hypothetical protein
MVNPLLAHQILRFYHTLKKSSGWPVFSAGQCIYFFLFLLYAYFSHDIHVEVVLYDITDYRYEIEIKY